MYMDLTDMISGGTEEQQIPEQKLTKEEYAAKKQQEREEVWAEVDSQASRRLQTSTTSRAATRPCPCAGSREWLHPWGHA